MRTLKKWFSLLIIIVAAAGSGCGGSGSTGATGPAGPGITWVDVTGTSVQAVTNTGYMADSVSQVTVTLPATLRKGDIVQVSGVGGWKVAQNPNQTIITSNLPGSIGAVWTPRDSARNWQSVASSSDGTRLVAVVYGGQIYTSTDSGATWTPRDSARNWQSVASSSDGMKLVAVEKGGQIYTSTDSGATWTPRDSARGWWSVASSSDGTKLVAAVSFDQLYTSTPNTTVGVDGSISGGQYDAIALQYIGSDTFTVLSHEGDLVIQ